MIVVLTGSHSCGKSTLVEFFRGKEGFVCVDSVTRKTATKEERKIDGSENLDDVQMRILDNILEATDELLRMEKEDPDKVYLVDRCAFDFVAYSRAFYGSGKISWPCQDKIEEACKDLWKAYDLVCYLGIEFNIVDDGVRSLDETLRKKVDREILDQVLWNPVKAVQLRGSVRQRVQTLYDAINSIRLSRELPG